MDFPTLLRMLRARANLSQRELSEVVGIDRRIIGQIEAGKLLPGPEWEARLKEALNWSEDIDEAFAMLPSQAGEPVG